MKASDLLLGAVALLLAVIAFWSIPRAAPAADLQFIPTENGFYVYDPDSGKMWAIIGSGLTPAHVKPIQNLPWPTR